MSAIQCPHCFERIEFMVDVRKNFHSRRCPQGKSAREVIGASLNHCYCKKMFVDESATVETLADFICCKCGDVLRRKDDGRTGAESEAASRQP